MCIFIHSLCVFIHSLCISIHSLCIGPYEYSVYSCNMLLLNDSQRHAQAMYRFLFSDNLIWAFGMLYFRKKKKGSSEPDRTELPKSLKGDSLFSPWLAS